MARGYPDFEGDKSSIYSEASWAAKEANDKNFISWLANQATFGNTDIAYVVPAGKTLYITQISFMCHAFLAANCDLNQFCWAFIQESIGGAFKYYQGGNGGGGQTFTKPLVFIAGQALLGRIQNATNHNATIAISIGGYEL
ncbi:unnamed protein product [marine sediment metagenome]|uniref:Uncharacterized protein n=1 Tax=marine sediment metagenome TaxID=412755 RepID=X1H5E8_9ZZZZ